MYNFTVPKGAATRRCSAFDLYAKKLFADSFQFQI